MSDETFVWVCHPEAELFISKHVENAIAKNPFIKQLANDLQALSSTRLFDWLDHIIIHPTKEKLEQLKQTGFVLQNEEEPDIFMHPGAQLPRVVCKTLGPEGLALSVDSIAEFIMAHQGSLCQIEGALFGAYRSCLYCSHQDQALYLIERRGTLTLNPTHEKPAVLARYYEALEMWMTRKRDGDSDEKLMEQTVKLVKKIIQKVGQQRAAWTVLEGERRYWQVRNTAGQIQKNRQDKLGIGWANHDHHTFRSSRHLFPQLVHLFELLGFHCRERFYAGKEAGWGAQVMENPICRLVLFLDVDLSEDEITQDFAHEAMPTITNLGTIGLWCALHGDSILRSGMHHLEAQFLFDDLTSDLAKQGVQMMNPFSSFPYLRQAFTVGEMWPVDPNRLQRLVEQKQITQEKAEQFLQKGALGSHLENLQRREGYKGFNQKNVSTIIKKTDPRSN